MFSKETVIFFVEIFNESLQRATKRSSALPYRQLYSFAALAYPGMCRTNHALIKIHLSYSDTVQRAVISYC